jgi:hypothetical protein
MKETRNRSSFSAVFGFFGSIFEKFFEGELRVRMRVQFDINSQTDAKP